MRRFGSNVLLAGAVAIAIFATGSAAHAKSDIWTDSATKITYCVGKAPCRNLKNLCTLGVFSISVFRTGLVTGSCAPPSNQRPTGKLGKSA